MVHKWRFYICSIRSASRVFYCVSIVAVIPQIVVFCSAEEEDDDDAKELVSKAPGTKNRTVPAEPGRRKQKRAKIRIRVKEEKNDALGGERN